MTPLRKCRVCGLEAHTEEDLIYFVKRGRESYGRENICYECQREYDRNRYHKKKAKDPEWYKKRQANSSIKQHGYNCTVEEYIEIMDSAVECEVCGRTENLVFDHDHTTGDFRGVLCSQCNLAIGQLGDDIPVIIERLKKYINKE